MASCSSSLSSEEDSSVGEGRSSVRGGLLNSIRLSLGEFEYLVMVAFGVCDVSRARMVLACGMKRLDISSMVLLKFSLRDSCRVRAEASRSRRILSVAWVKLDEIASLMKFSKVAMLKPVGVSSLVTLGSVGSEGVSAGRF